MTVPNGPGDVATFGLSNNSNVSISANTEVNGIIITPGGGCSITVPPDLAFTLGGTGISGGGVGFRVPFGSTGGGELLFADIATAGNSSIDNEGGLFFTDNSTAGTAEIFNDVGIRFSGTSSAGGAIINSLAGVISFSDSSTADHVFIAGGDLAGSISFANTSSAGSATISYLGGGDIDFSGSSTGGTARIIVAREGALSAFLSIGGHNPPGVTIGSIEGSGFVTLGANNLTVGSNNLSTTLSGWIQDSGLGGSLTKIGAGALDLTGANTYTGDTNIDGGVLQVDGSVASDTFVNRRGILSGTGTVNGNVTNRAGTVSPGKADGETGVLTVTGNYTTAVSQDDGATLSIQVGGTDVNQVSVLNVTGNAHLSGYLEPVLVNGFVPEIGQSFTIMNYASFTGFFSRIKNHPLDNGRKRWSVTYNPTSVVLTVVGSDRAVRYAR